MSFLEPPAKIPLILRAMLALVERRLGRRLLANRILAWYPKALVGSGVMEALVAHGDREVPARLLTMVRLRTAFRASCPFCVDMNARDLPRVGITDDERAALQAPGALSPGCGSFSDRERAALCYVDCITGTPLAFPPAVIEGMRTHFTERAMVIVASTSAQVNFWARLIQSLGVPPAGFSESCAVTAPQERGSPRSTAAR
jgi:alkylhydroperoxidase family enzyme